MSSSRASKACQTCHRRRVKCDASEVGLPCTRCKQGGVPDCRFIVSRRGTYDRRKRKLSMSSGGEPLSPELTRQSGSPSSVSWSTVVDEMFSRSSEKKVMDTKSITYLGESLLLPLMMMDDRGGGVQMHHEVGNTHPNHLSQQELALLESKGAFTRCAPRAERALVAIFLDNIYRMYPVVNRQEFLDEYNADKTPWILLHAVCFISSIYAPVSLLHSCGFTDPVEARNTFYTRGKILFDLNYERNKLVLVQAQILFSFYVGRPDDLWYAHTWIGMAVTTAETLGMHRTMTIWNMPEKDKSLFRRLFWILFNRDASIAALFGRTPRVNIEHCDKEVPCLADFEGVYPDEAGAYYQIELSKLTLILREITVYRCNDTPWEGRNSYLCERLIQWKGHLPPVLQWDESSDDLQNTNINALCLEMLYHHHIIYIHLPNPNFYSSSSSELQSLIDTATRRITAIARHWVTSSLISRVPHECYPAIFAAEVVLYSQMKHGDPNRANLARAQLDVCQMTLREICHYWESASWIMHLFEVLINKHRSNNPSPSSSGFQTFCEDVPNRTPDQSGLNDFIAFLSAWQGNEAPLLESNELNSLFHNILD
ncbi:hypothetical protein TRICI_003942 [Trichomonascus ciferrii]|uniref:Zn(2)-C6 fungal-type domain-containing protein n=1 Tax=Trichomonascus ciferrii TaxID=44093 RepID=A0A642V2C4_9ASCO|nr:hypothetical protein TRICI_003942 [Trichomonascus ciferrii]